MLMKRSGIFEKTIGDQAALCAKENILAECAKKSKLDSDGKQEVLEDYTKSGVPLTKISGEWSSRTRMCWRWPVGPRGSSSTCLCHWMGGSGGGCGVMSHHCEAVMIYSITWRDLSFKSASIGSTVLVDRLHVSIIKFYCTTNSW